MRQLRMFACVALAVAGGCKDKEKQAGSPAATGESEKAPAAEGEKGGQAAKGVKIRVVLTGGSDAGTYEATPEGSTCIDYQSTGINGLGIAHFADPMTTKGLTVIDFGIKEKVPVASSEHFEFTVGIGKGEEVGPKNYLVFPERGQGSGTVSVSGAGPRYTVKVTGKTADGVGVEATLICLG